ncbi:MAG: hypothetical protein KC425_03925, partial [Anaerolineales bacterium]|nr:hypothetical protein [Anaerolineales bacterium]
MKSVHSEPAPDGTGSSPISPDPSSFTFVDPQMTAFLSALRELVLTETAAQRQQIHAHWRKPLPARIAEGYAIANPRLVDVRPNGQAVLACTRNDARFRPGDILRLSRNDPFAPDGLMVNLDDEEADELIISAELPVNWRQLFSHGDDWTLDVGLLDLSSYVLDALAEAGDTLVG